MRGTGPGVAARVVARLVTALVALAATGVLLARTAPHDWPRGFRDVPRWIAAPPPEARVLALATLAAYACLAWLALVLVVAAAGSGVRVAPASLRRSAERFLGVALAAAAAGVLAAGPAAADAHHPHGGWPNGGPFDRPVATAISPAPAPTSARTPTAPPPAPDRVPIAAPAPSRPAPVAGPPRGTDPEGAVVVLRGDTLWDIAARHLGAGATPARVAAEWPRWYAANRAVVGPDPGRILPGQRLVPPAVAR